MIQYFSTENDQSQSRSDAQLWVDRYRPARFADLCGDERVHRETMNWLKEWDSCVFGKKRNKAKKQFREEESSVRGSESPLQFFVTDQVCRTSSIRIHTTGPERKCVSLFCWVVVQSEIIA